MYNRVHSFSRGRKSRRKIKILRLLILIVACLAVVALIAMLAIYLIGSSKLENQLVRLNASSTTQILSSDSNLYTLDGDVLVSTDYSGKDVWSVKLPSDNLSVAASNNLICAYNKTTLQVLNTNKENLFAITSENEIADVRCGLEHVSYLTTLTNEEGITSPHIIVFDQAGTKIDDVELQAESVLDFGFTRDSDTLWVLTLDTSGVAPISRISTYAPGQSITGVIDINDTLVEKVYFDQDNIVASSTNQLYYYNYFNEELDSLTVYGLEPIDVVTSDGNIGFVYKLRQSNDYLPTDSIRVVSNSLEEISIQLPPEIAYIVTNNDKIYCFDSETMYTYNINGTLENTHTFEMPINNIQKLNSGHLLIQSNLDYYILPL